MLKIRLFGEISIRGRFMIGIHLFFCLSIIYIQRININVVIAQIVTINGDDQNKFEWTKLQKSLTLMSFFAGYWITQIPGGLISERYGPKRPLAIAAFFSSVLCIATPAAFEASVYWIIFIRILMAIFQGIFLPSFLVMVTNWFPAKSRSTAIGLTYPGTYFGTILGMAVPSGLAQNDELWRISFYLFGGIGFIWILFWMVFTTDDPNDNRWIKDEEKKFISENVDRKRTNIKDFPVWDVITSPPVWAIISSQFSVCWALYAITTLTPSLIKDLFYIQVKNQTYITFLIPILTWAGGTCGCTLFDFINSKNIISNIKLRKIFNNLSLVPTGLLLMLATLVPPEKYILGIFLILLANLVSGFDLAVALPNCGDIAPQYSGTIFGIANTLGSFAGVISIQSAYLIVTDQHKPYQWQIVFGMMIVVEFVASLLYSICAKGTLQSWAIQKEPSTNL